MSKERGVEGDVRKNRVFSDQIGSLIQEPQQHNVRIKTSKGGRVVIMKECGKVYNGYTTGLPTPHSVTAHTVLMLDDGSTVGSIDPSAVHSDRYHSVPHAWLKDIHTVP